MMIFSPKNPRSAYPLAPTQYMTYQRQKERGFTLMEVLIAMAVFAVMSAALATATQRNAQYATRLEEKSIAHWVAMNKVAELQGRGEWPQTGSKDEDVEMAGREWEVTTKVTDSQAENYRLIEVTVSLKGREFSNGAKRVSMLKTLLTNPTIPE